MRNTLMILLFMVLSNGICQKNKIKPVLDKNHVILKVDLLGPILSIFTQPNSFGVSGEFLHPKRFSVQLNENFAFSNSIERKQFDYQIIPEFRYPLSNKNSSSILFTGISNTIITETNIMAFT